MSQINEQAFPAVVGQTIIYKGLSKREFFAAIAMQGLLMNDPNKDRMLCDREDISVMAVRKADALLAELEKTK